MSGHATMKSDSDQEQSVEPTTQSRYETVIDAVGDGIYELDDGGNFVMVNDAIAEATGYDRQELLGANVSLLLDEDDFSRTVSVMQELAADDGPEVGRTEFDVHTADGSVVPCEARIALLRADGEIRGSVGVVRDVSEREQLTNELDRRSREFKRLLDLTGVVRSVNRAFVDAGSREDLEQRVCDLVARSERYDVAWLAEHSVATGTLTPTRVAGTDEGFFARIADTETTDFLDGPLSGLDEGIVVTEDIASSPLPAAGTEYDAETVMAANVLYDTNVYGCLVVHADRPDGFSERERDVFAELGRTVGVAINAIERKAALLAGAVVEVEARSRSVATEIFGDVAAEADRSTVERIVPIGDGGYVLYVTTTGLPAERCRNALTARPIHERVTDLDGGEDDCRFQIRSTSLPVLSELAECGARIRAVELVDGELRLTVALRHGVEASTVFGPVMGECPDLRIVSQRSLQPDEISIGEFRAVTETLTARQRAALEAAHAAGYYDWPRTAAAADIADALDISQSTLSEHLRAAERKLFAALFDDR